MNAPQFLQSRFRAWLQRRLPAARRIRLNQKRLFILPTKAGLGFLALTALLWLLATNYQNSPIFAISCLLSSLLVTAILHSYANLAGLELSFVSAEPVFAGQQMLFRIAVSRSDKRHRQSIELRFASHSTELQSVSLLDASQQMVVLSAATAHRGWFEPGRVTVQSRYPLGLLRVWTHLDLNCRGLVYPQPLVAAPANPSPAYGVSGQKQATVGSDDFSGFKDYHNGEPLQHVAWKHYARERGLLSKQYADAIDKRLWLSWLDYPGMDREARLSRLCGRLLEVASQQTEYGLRLPGVEVPLGRGDSHQQRILRELALFELATDGEQRQ